MAHQKIEALKAAKKSYEDQVKSVGQETIKEVLGELFKRFPVIEAVRWKQYTPYFNDGDPCVFGCNAGYCDVRFAGDVDFSREGYYSGPEQSDKEEAIEAFQSALGDIPEDVYETVFGDHSQVIATRDSIEVEEYEHD